MGGRKNNDNTQWGLVSTTGQRSPAASAGDGIEPLVDAHGRVWTRSADGGVLPPSSQACVKLGPAIAGAVGASGRVMRITGIVSAAGFAQFFDQLGPPAGGDVPLVATQLLAAGNFDLDFSGFGGLNFSSGGIAFGWSTTRDTYTAGIFDGVGWAQVLAPLP